ncbi:MAG TPA: DNA primase [Candidatus Saccharimonadales bacterium]|nr:DNA primase [Candidatus Saccharimonadales bacterium]
MDAVEDIKQRLSIEDVVSEYVQLKRSGRNLKGLSPFTSEKTPSFMVSPEKQIWHDFSSNKGGDMFSFVMEAEGLDFKGALELLARKAGVDLDKYRGSTRRGPNKERLFEANEAAAHFYQVQFSKNKTALEYVFKKRQFTKETALAWRLGYSPNNGTALVDFLKSKKFSDAEIKQAGLSAQRYRGLGDMFRGRLMIPLMDQQGRVIGFTARLLADDPNAPKYINTPQTPLYDKSRHVYGLHAAKEAIRKGGYSVLAEGNLDVIASHQAGVAQTVATAGTALTEYQLKTLGRFAPDVRLSFDQDRAGLAAAERAIPIASKVGVSLSIVTIPSGKDPDELIKQDPKLWEQAISQPQYALDWLMARYETLLDITSAEGKRKYSDVLLPIVQRLNDAVEKDHYITAIAEKIGVSREALLQKQRTTAKDASPRLRKMVAPQPLDKVTVENTKVQDHFLAIMHEQPELREYLESLTPDMLYTDEARQLFARLKRGADKMQNLENYDKIVALEYEELYQGLELTELRYEAARLQARLIEQYVKTEKAKLVAQLSSADESATQVLLGHVRDLDTLLRRIKGGA